MAQARDEHNVGPNVAFLTYSLLFVHSRALIDMRRIVVSARPAESKHSRKEKVAGLN